MGVKQELTDALAAYGGSVVELEKALQELKTSLKRKKGVSSSPLLVELIKVSKIYKTAKHTVAAASDVSVKIHEGEIVALVGPSGSGKSTVLNLISGLDSPTEGSVLVEGTDITKLNPNQRAKFRSKHLGFVFQFFYLQPFLTLKTNVEVPAMFAGINHAERAKRSQELIEAVGLGDRLNHLPKELSGGQMQRAAIARALLNRPKLILADEPTGNLDSKNAQDVMDLFEKVRSEFGTTIIVVTHDPKIAERADYIIELADGKVVS